jgi:predicted AlkP superfamily pyrophosphatase or phosphodiesterase
MIGARLRAGLLLLGAALFIALVAALGIGLVIARSPPTEVASPRPSGPPLTRRLALVIVDGLRYDLAVDDALMPRLAGLMRERTSGEVWANPVSMTSSAILTYATGQRGDIEQIVNNETVVPVAYDHLMKTMKGQGLVTAYTGDRAWFRMFPGAWDLSHPDPKGSASRSTTTRRSSTRPTRTSKPTHSRISSYSIS